MKFHARQYIFDFKNMYFYADFSLRKNHIGLGYEKNSYEHWKTTDRKPNMELLTFYEMRFRNGELLSWCIIKKAWVRIYPYNNELHQKVVTKYLDYIFENTILIQENHNGGRKA